MKWSVLLAFLVVTGCRVVYPGDGRLVILELSEAVETARIEVDVPGQPKYWVSVGNLVRDASLWWDEAGAKLRVRDQVSYEDLDEIDTAPVLRVEIAECCNPKDGGRYELYPSGVIYLQYDAWVQRVVDADLLWIASHRATIAHELGHAMGHDHIENEEGAVMNAPTSTYFGLGQPDLKQHERLWGKPRN
jgi:hypothetical protein